MTLDIGVPLACGCAAMAVHHNAHDGLAADHPSCFVHDCCTVVPAPDLMGRRARCDDFGKPTRHNECNYGGGRDTICGCERPSSPDLAFFVFCGEGSESAMQTCVCGFHRVAHEVTHMAQVDRDRPTRRPTVIESGECSGFRPRGASPFDRFYCGCQSWD